MDQNYSGRAEDVYLEENMSSISAVPAVGSCEFIAEEPHEGHGPVPALPPKHLHALVVKEARTLEKHERHFKTDFW